MQDLRARLTNGGFPNVSFRIIISKPNYETKTESMDNLRSFAGDIPVIEESEKFHPIWQSILEGEVDHILVLDRCGRLAFQVISPWSLLSYPYVKAAILSTYNDDPCGPCNATENEAEASYIVTAVDNSTITQTDPDSSEIQTTDTTEEQVYNLTHAVPSTTPLYSYNSQTAPVDEQTMEMEENSTHKTADSSLHNTLSSTEELHINIVVREKMMPQSPAPAITEQSDYKDNMMEAYNPMYENELDATLSPLAERKDGSVPIRVIMRFPHHHIKNGTISEYEYLVLQTGNPDYHGHLESEENQDLVPPDDNGFKKHLSEKGKLHKGKKHHNSRKPVESDERDEVHENKNIEKHKHKGSKHKNKIKHRGSGEIIDDSNEEKSLEIKKNKGKIKVKKTEMKVEQESGVRKNSKGEKIHNRVNTAESEGIQETTVETPHHYSSVTSDTQETRETGSTEEDKHKGYDNSGMSHSNEDDGSTSEMLQDIRKHGKHQSQHSGNTTHHLNMIKHNEKPDKHHNKHKVTVSVNTDINGTDHVRKLKINKKMHIGLNTNDTGSNVDTVIEEHTSENGSTQFIKKTEVHKKMHRVPTLKDSITTPLPLPIVLYNVNKVNDSKPKQIIQNSMKGKLKPGFKNAYSTQGGENRLEDEDNLQTLEQIDVITNLGKSNTSNSTQIETSNEENDSEGKDDNIIEHYSKLLKWIEYQL